MNETNTPSPLFSPIEPFASHMLEVGDGHTLYVEQSGNPDGLPVVVLHGGPGSGSKPKHRQFFDPTLYHIVLFDQRGCGKSLPSGETHANTTAHLIADIERIRAHVNVENWAVYGNSWGSTLALAYAEAHPERIRALMVGAIFMATARELEWFHHPDGLARFFPQEYKDLCETLGNPAYENIPQMIRDAVAQDNPHAWNVGRAVSLLDGLSMDLVPNRTEVEACLHSAEFSLTPVRVWSHYFASNCFLTPDELIAKASRIPSVPVHILHAALDLCCPVESAVRLHNALPHSTLDIIPLCGHRASPEMEAARVEATTAIAKRLGF